jgi:hypothetical protein
MEQCAEEESEAYRGSPFAEPMQSVFRSNLSVLIAPYRTVLIDFDCGLSLPLSAQDSGTFGGRAMLSSRLGRGRRYAVLRDTFVGNGKYLAPILRQGTVKFPGLRFRRPRGLLANSRLFPTVGSFKNEVANINAL